MKYIQKFKDIIEKILIDVNDKKFINYNLKKYKDNKIKINQNNKNVILIDLFDWKPWIVIWSYLIPFMCKKLDYSARFFYVDLYQGNLSKKEIYIRKIKKYSHHLM